MTVFGDGGGHGDVTQYRVFASWRDRQSQELDRGLMHSRYRRFPGSVFDLLRELGEEAVAVAYYEDGTEAGAMRYFADGRGWVTGFNDAVVPFPLTRDLPKGFWFDGVTGEVRQEAGAMTETRKLVRVWIVCMWDEYSHELRWEYPDEDKAWQLAEELAKEHPGRTYAVLPGVRMRYKEDGE